MWKWQMRTLDVLFYYSLLYCLKIWSLSSPELVLQPPSPTEMIPYINTTHINLHT